MKSFIICLGLCLIASLSTAQNTYGEILAQMQQIRKEIDQCQQVVDALTEAVHEVNAAFAAGKNPDQKKFSYLLETRREMQDCIKSGKNDLEELRKKLWPPLDGSIVQLNDRERNQLQGRFPPIEQAQQKLEQDADKTSKAVDQVQKPKRKK